MQLSKLLDADIPTSRDSDSAKTRHRIVKCFLLDLSSEDFATKQLAFLYDIPYGQANRMLWEFAEIITAPGSNYDLSFPEIGIVG